MVNNIRCRQLWFVFRVVAFSAILLFTMEAFFRFVLHAREYPRSYQDLETGVSHADTSWVTEGTGSFGPYCLPSGKWRINNAGWNSVFDYYPRTNHDIPRVAILGNSYIEALASDVEYHIDAELVRLIEDSIDVYSFGVSGATFAQFLGMIPYIESEFDPDLYLIMLGSFGISRSLDSSFSPYRFFVALTDSGYNLFSPPEAYSRNPYGRVVFRSALARYLWLNRQVGVERLDVESEEMVLDSSVPEEIPVGHYEAARFFLQSFEEELRGKKVIFFADGNRQAIYEGLTEYPKEMDYRILEGVMEEDEMFSLVDLTDFMRDEYAENGIRFSTDYDPHWNNHAHRTAARALLPHVLSALDELGY